MVKSVLSKGNADFFVEVYKMENKIQKIVDDPVNSYVVMTSVNLAKPDDFSIIIHRPSHQMDS